MAPPKTAPYSWLSHPLAGMASTTWPVSTSSRQMPIVRSIGGPRQLAAEVAGGFKPKHSLERRTRKRTEVQLLPRPVPLLTSANTVYQSSLTGAQGHGPDRMGPYGGREHFTC
jgi:hypothetical protein